MPVSLQASSSVLGDSAVALPGEKRFTRAAIRQPFLTTQAPPSWRQVAAPIRQADESERSNGGEAGRLLPGCETPVDPRWVDDATRQALLTEQCADDVLLATDIGVAALRARRFAPGQPPEALLNRWLVAGDDLSAMMSMRYEGGDPAKPFVDATVLSHRSQPTTCLRCCGHASTPMEHFTRATCGCGVLRHRSLSYARDLTGDFLPRRWAASGPASTCPYPRS